MVYLDMSEVNNFQQILDGVVAKVTGDNSDEVKSSLRQLGVLHKDSVESLVSFGSENKEKRILITKLEQELRDATDAKNKLTAEMEDITKNSESTNNEIAELRSYKDGILKERLKSFTSTMEEITTHPKFEALKGKFTLPEANADGSYDVSKLSSEELEGNFNKYNEYKELGIFESSTPAKEVDGTKHNKKVQGVTEQIEDAKTMDDLLNLQAQMD